MKLAVAALCIAPAVAFSPAALFGTRRTALHMSTEAVAETKVGFVRSFVAFPLILCQMLVIDRREVCYSCAHDHTSLIILLIPATGFR
jgi:hypothetical protein